jgi:hypothetical protein
MLTKFPFHPLLLSIYPILYLYARNIVFTPLNEVLRPFAISILVSALLLLGFRILLRDWEKAGVLGSLLVVLFFTFGHVANAVQAWLSHWNKSLNVFTLAWIWLFLFFVLSFVISMRKIPDITTQLLNLTGLVLLLFPLITIISTFFVYYTNSQSESEVLSQLRDEVTAEATLSEISEVEMPDIYYIIFDGYERADLLEQFYEYDITSFIEALEERGFYLLPSSRSNFLNTTYSLNTSLNMIYFNEFPTRIFRQARYNLQTNYVSEFLRNQGYQIVVFDSGTGDTNNQYSDYFISPTAAHAENTAPVNPFEQLLLRTTMGLLIFEGASHEDNPEKIDDIFIASINQELSVRRERITHALTHLSDFASEQGPHFLFAHIYLPHIPFLYGQDGEELQYHENLNLYWYEVEPENYDEYYTYQIEYLNQAVIKTIDRILQASVNPVVIILQSDHGDEKYLNWDQPTAQGVNVRSAILNAIYFSDNSYEELYPSMSPVNTFRVTFNHWFGTQYPILEDKVFFHEHSLSTPFNKKPEFIDACEEFDICLPTQPN